MSEQDFQVLVQSPAGAADASLAIAAARAGYTGVLNLEFADAAERAAATDRLIRFANGPIGLRLVGTEPDAGALVKAAASHDLRCIILDADVIAENTARVKRMLPAGVALLAEVTSWKDSYAKLRHISGIVVKGHEAGGMVGEATSFILLQRAANAVSCPIYVRGGVGLHAAAAVRAGGGAGVILDDQCLMLRESAQATQVGNFLERFTGIETELLEVTPVGGLRLFERPGLRKIRALRREHGLPLAENQSFEADLDTEIGWDIQAGALAPMGQAATFAPEYAARYATVGRLAQAYEDQSERNVTLAARLGVLSGETGVAQTHNTRYPIVQGPMTRVSDTADFAASVAQGGALPMLALALMRPDKVESLLAETAGKLQGKPWGIGLLGFAPSALMRAQIDAALKHGPSFALIAGGRPDQARELEADGIPSYLHVPSPRLLSMFLEQGARRFVFEGRECGGHVGPLSSFVLWDSMVSALLDNIKDDAQAAEINILFAGGIHDARSAAMVAAVAAPLAERGVQIGVLVGTAYLFTQEAVAGHSIVDGFQQIALDCAETVTLETGPGHASRAAISPFATEFAERRRALLASDTHLDDVRNELEDLTLGRLRIASKGTERQGDDIVEVPEDVQNDTGMYMIGQVATLRDKVTTIADLHAALSDEPAELLAMAAKRAVVPAQAAPSRPADVAIVGISALLPQADSATEYWDNILDQRSAVREIPRERWDYRMYFDEDREAKDRIYSKWGGFLDDMPFDPFVYGIPPNAIKAIDPLQLMTLEVARRCLADAGYDNSRRAGAKASVILGASGGAGDVGAQYAVRSEMTRVLGEVDPEAAKYLPEWTEDSFAGILLNVAAGRSANRFDFGGVNYTIDAACASSLAAIYQGVVELETGRSDLVIAGGVDTVQGPFGYLCFSKTHALSPTGQSNAFHADANGIVISEGIAILAMKRLADAERDGDRIYSVIKGVGGSSDGRAKSMTAPHPDGQIRALRRAYQMAGYTPDTVGLFEAHGTGTVAGDTAELETVTRLLDGAGAGPKNAAIGSVKSLIGHTKATAGAAGVIKAAMACYHGVLPPHGLRGTPNQRFTEEDTRLYVATDPLPWLRRDGLPRRAGISAFGFGGTNFHLTMEEYDGAAALPATQTAPRNRWASELFVWRGADRAAIAGQIEALATAVTGPDVPRLRDLAYSVCESQNTSAPLAAALVITGEDDIGERLQAFAAQVRDPAAKPVRDGFVADTPLLADGGKLAFVYPGQGTQYPNMLRDLAVAFPEIADALENADQVLAEQMAQKNAPQGRLSRVLMPTGIYDDAAKKAAAATLTRTDFAQPALGAVEAG